MERSYVVSVRWQRNQVFHRMKILSLEKKSNHNPTGFRQWVKVAKSSGLCYALAMGTWNQKKTDTSICYNNRAGTARINGCGDSRLRSRRSKNPRIFRFGERQSLALKL